MGTSTDGTGGVGGAGSLDLSKLGALLATPGGASLNYSQLIASLQGQQPGTAPTNLTDLLGGPSETRQSQAFDKDALARLAKEAKEKPADEVAVETSLQEQTSSLTEVG